jgi:hypothetical protein
MAGLAGMITSHPDEIVLRPKRARRLAKNLARKPQARIHGNRGVDARVHGTGADPMTINNKVQENV